MEYGQIEIYSDGSTHTLHETCGHSDCNILILEALGVGDERFKDQEEFHSDGAKITVQPSLDDSDSCVWCMGCGAFLRHANASLEPDGTFFGCECPNRDEDREPMEPMIPVNGWIELRPFAGK